jgi:hypothetical protein
MIGFWRDRTKVKVDASLGISRSGPACLILRATNIGVKAITIEGLAVLRGTQTDFRPRSNGLLTTLEPTEQLEHRWVTTIIGGKVTGLGMYDTEGRVWEVRREEFTGLLNLLGAQDEEKR